MDLPSWVGKIPQPKSAATPGSGRSSSGNLREWSGASDSEAERIASTWLAPAEAGWAGYFSLREKLAQSSSNPNPGLIAEEDYTLMHRALTVSVKCAATMLSAMRSVCPARHAALPQPRTIITRMMRGF